MVRQAHKALLTIMAAGVLGCTQTNVVPVAVGEIVVVPDRIDALVSDLTALSTELRDQDGNLLPDRDVSWASLDPQVVTVDQQGLVTAVGPGQALVTATADGAVGTAQFTVQLRPTVRITPDQLDVEGVRGSGAALNHVLTVDNSGAGTLGTLSVNVQLPGDTREWLTAKLSSTSAPADLTVTARASGLATGTYTGQVVVSSSSGSSASLPVSFNVMEPPPEIYLSTSSLNFVVVRGTTPPGQRSVQVTNGGGGSLTGLTTQITYGQGSGWLTASLSSSQAPSTLRVGPTTSDLAPGTYTASVRVRSPVASTRTVAVSYEVVDPDPPTAPNRLRANAVGSNRIDLDWRDRSDNETRFEIQRREAGQSWILLATLGANTEQYSDVGLQPETWYQYRVRACNLGGCSDYSQWEAERTDDD